MFHYRILFVAMLSGTLALGLAGTATASPLGKSRVAAIPSDSLTILAMGKGKLFRDLIRALNSRGKANRSYRPIPRNGQPKGGNQNHNRVHTERYGSGSVSGTERDWGQLTPAERQFSRELAQAGFNVRLVPTRRDQKTPDFEIHGVTLELKTLTNFGRWTVYSNLKKAVGQHANFIINCRNVSRANIDSVRRQIQKFEADKGISLEGRVITWMPDGSTFFY